MAVMADLKRLKDRRHLSHFMISAWRWALLWDINDANHLYATVVLGPIPPVAAKTRGKNDPCFTSRTCWS